MLNKDHQSIMDQSDLTRDMHSAIIPLKEEFESIEWYNQKIVDCEDSQLKQLLIQNRDEEKNHASMVMEWIRHTDASCYEQLGEYLFTNKSIA